MPKNRPVSMPIDGARVCLACREVFNGHDGGQCNCGSKNYIYLTAILRKAELDRPVVYERTEDIPWMRNAPGMVRRQAI